MDTTNTQRNVYVWTSGVPREWMCAEVLTGLGGERA